MTAAERLKLETMGAFTLLAEGTVNLVVAAMLFTLARVFMVNRSAASAFYTTETEGNMHLRHGRCCCVSLLRGELYT